VTTVATQLRIATSGLPTVYPRGACVLCGCSDERACPGGCAWASREICTACAGRLRAILAPPRRFQRQVLERIACEQNANLLTVAGESATGDWRRAAIGRRLDAVLRLRPGGQAP